MHGKDKTSTQESVNIYKIILEIDENNLGAMMGLCTSYQDMKKYEEAMKWIDASLKHQELPLRMGTKGLLFYFLENIPHQHNHIYLSSLLDIWCK